MSNNYNQEVRDRIEMQVLSANYSFEDLLDELQMTYQEAYEEKILYWISGLLYFDHFGSILDQF